MIRTYSKPFIGLLFLLLTACGTVQDHRIRQFNAHFNTLESHEQDLLRKGCIEAGMSREAVFMALGTPVLYHHLGAGNQTWTYIGSIENEPEHGQPLCFFSRSEFRLPSAGSLRRQLMVSFQSNILQYWVLSEPDAATLQRVRSQQFGKMPPAN